MKVLPASGRSVLKRADPALAPAFSAIVLLDRAMSVGASFTLVTVIVKAFSVKRLPCVGAAHADRVRAVPLEVERGVGPQGGAGDVKAALSVVAGAADQGVGEGVARVGIGRAERADLALAPAFSAIVSFDRPMSVGVELAVRTMNLPVVHLGFPFPNRMFRTLEPITPDD